MHDNAVLERNTLVSVMVTSLATTFMGSAINVALPSIGNDLGADASMLSWMVSSFILASAVLLLPMGRTADIIGRKKLYITGITSFALTSLLCATAWSDNSLVFFRTIQGIAAAMIFATNMAILTSVFPPQQRGKAMGISVTATYIGLSVGPVLGGVMVQNIGWESIFYLTAIIGIIIAVFTWLNLDGEWAEAHGEAFDFTGSILYMGSIVAILFSISILTTSQWAIYLLTIGLLLLGNFLYYERKASFPLLDISLFFENPTFAFSNLATMINYTSTTALAFILSLYLQLVKGFDAQTTGLIMLSQPVIMAAFASSAGSLSDRVDPRTVASIGMGLNCIGLFIFTFLTVSTPMWVIISTLCLMGLGFALFSSPNSNAIMSSVESRYYGIASSSMSTMRLIGQSVSMAIVTLLINHYIGSNTLTPASAPMLLASARTAFMIFTVLCFAGIFASLARGKTERQGQYGNQ